MGSKLTSKQYPLHYVWVTNYYDFPLQGTCKHEGKLCRFEWDHENDTGNDVIYDIFTLSPKEKMIWKIRQFMFEICVGTHSTYNGNSRRTYFKLKKPKWLWQTVFSVYYKIKRM